jgi:LysM repeat protein
VAGLDGTPDTAATDEQNAVQDEINSQFGALQQQLTDQLAQIQKPPTTVTPPAGAKPSSPAPVGLQGPPSTNTGQKQYLTTAAPKPAAKAATPKTYTVVHGDNLSKIAAAHGLSLSQLEKLNPQIKNDNLIYSGQKVNL